jgi:hypothetical protein
MVALAALAVGEYIQLVQAVLAHRGKDLLVVLPFTLLVQIKAVAAAAVLALLAHLQPHLVLILVVMGALELALRLQAQEFFMLVVVVLVALIPVALLLTLSA